MTVPPQEKSPLTRLMLFVVCLAIAGTLVACAHYMAVDLPQQKSVVAPTNSGDCPLCYVGYSSCEEECAANTAAIEKTQGKAAAAAYYTVCMAGCT